MTIKEARLLAGLTLKGMSEKMEIPQRTIEAWESGTRKPPSYVEKLVIDELLRIANSK
jgi:DNA-binding transcriptional regulator YiaG